MERLMQHAQSLSKETIWLDCISASSFRMVPISFLWFQHQSQWLYFLAFSSCGKAIKNYHILSIEFFMAFHWGFLWYFVEVFCDRNISSQRRAYKHHFVKWIRINGFCFLYKLFFLGNVKIDERIIRYDNKTQPWDYYLFWLQSNPKIAFSYINFFSSSLSQVLYILHKSSLNSNITLSFMVIIPFPDDSSILFAAHSAVLLLPSQKSCLYVIRQNISMALSVLVLYDNRILLIALSTSFFSGTGGL